jgi:peptidyl-tRNA hydrolase
LANSLGGTIALGNKSLLGTSGPYNQEMILWIFAIFAFMVGYIVTRSETAWKRETLPKLHPKTYSFPPKTWQKDIIASQDPLIVGKGGSEEVPSLKLFVREDLGMSKGKAAAQCCHAAVGLSMVKEDGYQDGFLEWWRRGAPMQVYSSDSEQNLFLISAMAKAKGERTIVIRDAGRTQIKSGSRTVCGIAPSNVHLGQLKLY